MLLTPGETSCFSFNFVAKTQDVGKKIEVRPGARSTRGPAVGWEGSKVACQSSQRVSKLRAPIQLL
jgi:hypothetical protein